MNRATIPFCMALLIVGACNDDGTAKPIGTDEAKAKASPVASSGPAADTLNAVESAPPVIIKYRIIGQPIVGQPVAIDFGFESTLGAQPLNVSYRINDATAMTMPESQSLSATISPTSGDQNLSSATQQVTVIPMREGRLFLNVAAQIETEAGSWSGVTAVPIDVGGGPRQFEENGELVPMLPGKED